MWLMYALVLVLLHVFEAQATMKQIPLPDAFQSCMKKRCSASYYGTDPAEKICTNCLTAYQWRNVDIKCGRVTNRTVGVLRTYLKPLVEIKYGRQKRQAGSYRKEYRSMSDAERNAFHRALLDMKADGTYDEIANYHSFQVQRTAHDGPAFLPWHRLYLLAFERALQARAPGISLPYWDCSLDSKLGNPTDSIIWSEQFMGNGNGLVRSGPFNQWEIVRNHGGGGLITEGEEMSIKGITSSGEFTARIESAHNMVHSFVGGIMDDLSGASHDPIFFMHHANIDRIWKEWQSSVGEAGFTYPQGGAPQGHGPDDQMFNIDLGGGTLTNIDGYSRRYYDVSSYEPSPRCGGSCSGAYLRCVSGQCVSARMGSQEQVALTNSEQEVQQQNQQQTWQQLQDQWWQPQIQPQPQQLQPQEWQPQQWQQPQQGGFGGQWGWRRKKRSVKSVKKVANPEPRNGHSCLGYSLQNTFKVNCQADSQLWSYIAIKIVHIRAAGKIYNSYPVTNGKIDYTCDIFNNTMIHKDYIHPQNPPKYLYCRDDESGVFRVNIKSSGMNYKGTYVEYAYLDNRFPVDSKIVYVGFRRPDKRASKVYFSSFDQCGRICRPKCRVPGSRPPQYKSCTGYFSFDQQAPRHYGDSISEAALNYWNLMKGSGCPTSKEDNVDLVFYCDYTSDWWGMKKARK